jgi:hypothetical protein
MDLLQMLTQEQVHLLLRFFQQGNGEDASLKQVLLSSAVSAAQAIDFTAQSLVRVINKQMDSIVNAYYISGDNTPPGQINLEAKTLDPSPFYVLASNSDLGLSFNPDISPVNTNISSISVANPAIITTSSPHGMLSGQEIIITNSNSTPLVDGVHTVTVVSPTTFSVPVDVTVLGNQGSWSELEDATISSNEVKPNRVYYSKLGQPEAVPLLNYIDISAEDKEILRIFPLRDTLFVFKEDGTYRISGETAPFITSLLDSSNVVTAPDSVAVTNNIVYAWTDQGITPITETGAGDAISRSIDTRVLKLASNSYTNFSKVTWGIGYDSDSSYTVYTNNATTDEVATVGFRYCTLTNTWSNITRSQTCGVINPFDDMMFMGDGESNLIHKERKKFDRTDYCDNEFEISLSDAHLFRDGRLLQFTSVEGINVGDVITQEQSLSIYSYNALLKQLDNDPTVGASVLQSSSGTGLSITINTTTNHLLNNLDYVLLSGTNSFPSLDGSYQITNVTPTSFKIMIESPLLHQATMGTVKRSYELTLQAVAGDNMRTKIVELATWLDSDQGAQYNDYLDRISSKSGDILSNAVGDPTVVTTDGPHELVDGRVITIDGSQTPSSIASISGTFSVSETGIFGTSDTFELDVDVSTAGGTGLTYDTGPNLSSFADIKACFNHIVERLNDDNGVTFNTYTPVDETTLFEAVVLSVDPVLNKLTVNLPLQWVVGPMRVYNAINCEFVYAPVTMNDPLMTKQIYESTIMFNDRAITRFTASFSSDLKPEFVDVVMDGQGNGIFGHYSDPGFGFGFFGGSSNAAPFRTLIPRDVQRCRFINVKIKHCVSRESWSLYGVSLNGNEALSTRGYR